ncbi:MAG: sugar phosphate isomerase/epimerase family protein [Victivallales bacterium]
METIVSSLHFGWDNMENCFSRVKNEFGVAGVELSFHESFTRPHCTREDIASIRGTNESLGISLYAHIWENIAQLGEEKAIEAIRYWAEIGAKAGVKGFVIHGGSFPDQNEGIARTRRALEQVLPELEKNKMVLFLENHYAYDYKGCQELFSESWEFENVFSLDSPSLRFCFDTGHANLTGNTDDLLAKLHPYLSHIHLADNHGVNDDHCLYKEGTVKWDLVWGKLRDNKFDGTFCFEFPVRDDVMPFHQCISDIESLRTRKPAIR